MVWACFVFCVVFQTNAQKGRLVRKIDDKRLVCGVFVRWLFRFLCRVHEHAPNRNNDFCFKRKNALKKSCLHSVLRAFAQKRANFLQPYKLFVYFSSVALPNCRFFYMQRCFFKLQALQIFKTVKRDETLPFIPLFCKQCVYSSFLSLSEAFSSSSTGFTCTDTNSGR